MTIPKHAELIHAFADGKVLQHKAKEAITPAWRDWDVYYCPDFSDSYEWRIKPDEPKKVKYLAYEDIASGWVNWKREGTNIPINDFKRIPELDREVTLPVEE